jgi:hypothetical protein
MASGHVSRTQKAEHMAAPTNPAKRESSCQPGAVHTWHKAAGHACVRSLRRKGGRPKSPFDPDRTRPSRTRSFNGFPFAVRRDIIYPHAWKLRAIV